MRVVFIFYFFNFISFGLRWVFVTARELSLVAVSGGCCLYGVWSSRCGGFSCCRAWALERVGIQELQYVGSVPLQHVDSSQPRDLTWVPCIGRWILNHWTTRGVQE